MSTRVIISGMGAVSALGPDVEALWAGLSSGRDGIRPISRFSTEAFGVHLGGMVPSPARLAENEGAAANALCLSFALQAAREALAMARLTAAAPRLALILGTSMISEGGGLHRLTEQLAAALGLRGPLLTVSTACSSSTNAIGFALELLQSGRVDGVLVGGADALTPEHYGGFHALGLLSAGKCSPFSEQVGTTMGEGAGFLVLERDGAPQLRGARSRGTLAGYGLSADAHHATSPDPTGAGVARALRAALHAAGLPSEAVGYVNAHGTGTAANDGAEWRGLEQLLGARAGSVPVSSTKSQLGHAQGAAGILELISTALCLEQGLVPPTLHFTRARPRGPVDPVAQSLPRPHAVDWALCNNSAFGGANAAVVLGRPGQSAPGREVRRAVFLAGVGAIDAVGASSALARRVPTADTRGLDPSSCMLTAAAALALFDAGVQLKGGKRERAGLFVGTTAASPSMAKAFRASIDARGLAKLSAVAFTHLVLNAPAGAASRLLALKGPTTTLTCGRGSGLAALIWAAEHLARRDDADQLLAAGVDEQSDAQAPQGSAAVLLSTAVSAIRVAGWGIAAPHAREEAEALAVEHAGLRGGVPLVHPEAGEVEHAGLRLGPPLDGAAVAAEPRVAHGPTDPGVGWERITRVEPSGALAAAEATGALTAVARAVQMLREAEVQRVLISDASGDSLSLALILERSEPT